MASKAGFTKVSSIESCSNPAIAMASARTAQLGNGLNDPEAFQILQAAAEAVTSKDLLGGGDKGARAIVVGEGWYEKMETNAVLCVLNHYYIVRGLRRRGVIGEEALYLPRKFKIVGAPVKFEDLSKAYRNVGECCGFDHRKLDEHGAGVMQGYDMEFDLAQFRHEVIGKEVELICVDVKEDEVEVEGAWTTFHVGGGGEETRWDAFVTWVVMQSEGGREFKTRDGYHGCNVRFLNGEGRKVGEEGISAKVRMLVGGGRGGEGGGGGAYRVEIDYL